MKNKNSEDSTFYFERAIDKDESGDLQGAIEDYTSEIEINPAFSEAYYYRGVNKEILEDPKGAMEDWKKAAVLGNEEAAKLIK